jgi:hypothetical protein
MLETDHDEQTTEKWPFFWTMDLNTPCTPCGFSSLFFVSFYTFAKSYFLVGGLWLTFLLLRGLDSYLSKNACFPLLQRWKWLLSVQTTSVLRFRSRKRRFLMSDHCSAVPGYFLPTFFFLSIFFVQVFRRHLCLLTCNCCWR